MPSWMLTSKFHFNYPKYSIWTLIQHFFVRIWKTGNTFVSKKSCSCASLAIYSIRITLKDIVIICRFNEIINGSLERWKPFFDSDPCQVSHHRLLEHLRITELYLAHRPRVDSKNWAIMILQERELEIAKCHHPNPTTNHPRLVHRVLQMINQELHDVCLTFYCICRLSDAILRWGLAAAEVAGKTQKDYFWGNKYHPL